VYQQRVVIVGAGIVGLSTAYALLKQGMQHVTILEQAEVDHRRSTSHGLSRLLRFEYGADAFYSELVQLSLKRWRTLEHVTRQTLCTSAALLSLGNEGDNFTLPSYYTLRELGLPIERLSRTTCKQFFPQFAVQSYDHFTHNTEAGILHASTCLHTLKQLISDMGGVIQEAQRVTRITHDNQRTPVRVHCRDGETIPGDRIVLALGPWVHRLLGDLRLPIRMTRQYLLYFANLSAASYGIHTFPAFLSGELYGFPLHTSYAHSGPSWLKVASHTFGNPIDPDDISPIEERVIAQIKKKVYNLLPDLRYATLAHIDACMYDVSPDENFILDRHPQDPRIVFATGLSGHGFKFGLVLGELLSSLVREAPPPVSMERFQLARLNQYSHQAAFSVA
jgi:monomeric sarcosine oxidase